MNPSKVKQNKMHREAGSSVKVEYTPRQITEEERCNSERDVAVLWQEHALHHGRVRIAMLREECKREDEKQKRAEIEEFEKEYQIAEKQYVHELKTQMKKERDERINQERKQKIATLLKANHEKLLECAVKEFRDEENNSSKRLMKAMQQQIDRMTVALKGLETVQQQSKSLNESLQESDKTEAKGKDTRRDPLREIKRPTITRKHKRSKPIHAKTGNPNDSLLEAALKLSELSKQVDLSALLKREVKEALA